MYKCVNKCSTHLIRNFKTLARSKFNNYLYLLFIFTNSYHLKEWQKKELEQIKQLKFISAAHKQT